MDADAASRTAVLVCQGRAVAHGRIGVGRFDDPTAMALLREGERDAVARARADVAPKGWADRIEYEMLVANAKSMVPRTVAIHDAVRARPNPQLVVLGAGLDGRAWRMPELATVDAYEVDRLASQRDKQDRARPLQPAARSLRFVPVDFTRDALDPALAAAGHRADVPTTWIWEGVVPYLTPADVEATSRVVAERSAPGSRLVVHYAAPSGVAALGRVRARLLTILARRPDPLAGEPRRSAWTPASMRSLLAGHGFEVTSDDDLRTLAGRLSLPMPRGRLTGSGRVAVADKSP